MTKYRCTHCQVIFTKGEVRRCCLPAAISEQERLRKKIVKLQADSIRNMGKGLGLDDLFR